MLTRALPLLAVSVIAACRTAVQPRPSPQPGARRAWQATDYYQLVSLSEPQPSPDGSHLAFTVTTVVEDKDRRRSEVWVVPMDGSSLPTRASQSTGGGDASHPIWTPDGRAVAYVDSAGKVWFQPVRGAGRGRRYAVRGVNASPLFSPDGRWIAYGWRGPKPDGLEPWGDRVSPAAITRGPDPKRFDGRVYTSLPIVADERGLLPPAERRRPSHLYLVPAEGGEPRRLTDGSLSQTDATWSPDGRSIVFMQDSTEDDEARYEARPQLYVLNVTDGKIGRLATGFPESRSPAWSADGKWIAFVCSEGRGKQNDVCAIPAAGGAARNLTESWDLDPDEPQWSADSRTVYFSAETRGNLHLFATGMAGGPVRQVTTGERQLRDFALSPDGRWLVYTGSDVTRPVELYVAPADSGAERRLTSFNDALLAQVLTTPADTFWYVGGGGLRIQGWLMRPYRYEPGRTYPLVLSIHGGPHSHYGNVFFPEFQMLAGQGYWVLFTNPRGSVGYGHSFTFATRGRWGMEDYEDLMKALDVVIARGEVDTTRLGVLGGSYGGFMTTWIVAHTDRFKAAETDRSIYNFHSWYGSSDAQSLTDYEFRGPPWERDSLYRALSPMTYAKNIRTPMLIVHSEDDRRTPITDAEQLFVMLRRRGVPAEFVRYPRSFHGLSRTGPPWLLVDRLERVRTWFAHWLGTGENPPVAGSVH
jgi:dipeptidyl aminopeptidase/acylaminoacyl peptidase